MATHYRTDGKERLLAFLQEHADTPCTIEEIAAALPNGKSTLYRLMTGLVEDGTVRRFVKGNSRQFTYQILGGDDCHDHLHLKCVDCGRVVHLDHDTTAFVEQQLLKRHHFAADERATMLFGRCEACAARG